MYLTTVFKEQKQILKDFKLNSSHMSLKVITTILKRTLLK